MHFGSLPRSLAFRNDDRVAITDALHRMSDRTAFEGAYYADAETGTVHASAGTTAVIDDGSLRPTIRDWLAATTEDESQVVFSEALSAFDVAAEPSNPGSVESTTMGGASDLPAVDDYVDESAVRDDESPSNESPSSHTDFCTSVPGQPRPSAVASVNRYSRPSQAFDWISPE